MHAKPDLRVFLKWMITGSGSVIVGVGRSARSAKSVEQKNVDHLSCILTFSNSCLRVDLL
jgi:hypothetical protein